MPRLDQTGPEGEGSPEGRKLGKCNSKDKKKDELLELGKGKGERRHAGGGKGNAKRFKYDENK